MQRLNRYKLGKSFQYITLILLALLLVLVGHKLKVVNEKIQKVQRALAAYETGQWLEAEVLLEEAKANNSFFYKEEYLTAALVDLSWVRENQKTAKNLYEALSQEMEALDVSAFMESAESYKSSKLLMLEEDKRRSILKEYPIENLLNEGWEQMKSKLINKLQQPNSINEALSDKQQLFKIPEDYFSPSKEEEILSVFTACDEKLFEFAKEIGEEEGFPDLLEAINEIYVGNRNYHLETNWLTPKVQELVYSLIEAQTQGPPPTLFNYINYYRTLGDAAYKEDRVEELVSEYLRGKETEAALLVEGEAYEEAIKLYESLKYFKSYTKTILQLEAYLEFMEPKRLLSKKEIDYSHIISGTEGFGAKQYALGILKNTNHLEMVCVTGSKEDYEVEHSECDLGEVEATTEAVKEVLCQEDLIIIKRNLTEEEEETWVLSFKEGKFRLLLQTTSDKTTFSEDYMTYWENEVGNSEAKTYVYDGQDYRLQELEATQIDLAAENLLDFLGTYVSFNVYITESGEEVKGYGYSGPSYYVEQEVLLYWPERQQVEAGTYSGKGKVVASYKIIDEQTGEEITRPIIELIELE